VFIAAFDMLGENFALDGTAFLWIGDLAKPDRWLDLPWAIPFFGAHLNLLPFLMTALTLLAAWSQRDASLSADLQQQQARRLYLMAGAFFVLLYTFPAGMVLYWTSSNLFHLIKVQALQISARLRRDGSA
jgi:membrane protein insertase Oxa1/YidC/SpoIIIJ